MGLLRKIAIHRIIVLALLIMAGIAAGQRAKLDCSPAARRASVTGGCSMAITEAEAEDVTAVQEKYVSHAKGEGYGCGFDWCVPIADEFEKRWTCSDKSRILLTAEDGTKWCHAPKTTR